MLQTGQEQILPEEMLLLEMPLIFTPTRQGLQTHQGPKTEHAQMEPKQMVPQQMVHALPTTHRMLLQAIPHRATPPKQLTAAHLLRRLLHPCSAAAQCSLQDCAPQWISPSR